MKVLLYNMLCQDVMTCCLQFILIDQLSEHLLWLKIWLLLILMLPQCPLIFFMPQDHIHVEDQDLNRSIHFMEKEFDSVNFLENMDFVNSSFLKDIANLLNNSDFKPIQFSDNRNNCRTEKRMTSLSILMKNWTKF